MSNLKKYNQSFTDTFSLNDEKKLNDLKYNEIDEWDSIGHMTLIAALEESFKISFETDDIVDFSSYSKGKEILLKYKVKIED
ncbi:acyl carrier protein [Candidatus Pelagibacter communis]|jgi:acyl carrier protein|uniref:acyl carrier protein n=1 Tax=Pelagibacter ubique TaxID=198252 RepID=UPI00065B38EB|nr:acyl carrier protein [Candidatus Pelagibacter ubique]